MSQSAHAFALGRALLDRHVVNVVHAVDCDALVRDAMAACGVIVHGPCAAEADGEGGDDAGGAGAAEDPCESGGAADPATSEAGVASKAPLRNANAQDDEEDNSGPAAAEKGAEEPQPVRLGQLPSAVLSRIGVHLTEALWDDVAAAGHSIASNASPSSPAPEKAAEVAAEGEGTVEVLDHRCRAYNVALLFILDNYCFSDPRMPRGACLLCPDGPVGPRLCGIVLGPRTHMHTHAHSYSLTPPGVCAEVSRCVDAWLRDLLRVSAVSVCIVQGVPHPPGASAAGPAPPQAPALADDLVHFGPVEVATVEARWRGNVQAWADLLHRHCPATLRHQEAPSFFNDALFSLHVLPRAIQDAGPGLDVRACASVDMM